MKQAFFPQKEFARVSTDAWEVPDNKHINTSTHAVVKTKLEKRMFHPFFFIGKE